MAVRGLEVGATANAARGEVVVCIPVYGGHEHFVSCLDSVLAHTPAGVAILICDDASPDPRTLEHVRQLAGAAAEHEVLYMRRERNVGFPANVNGGLAAAAPADVIVLNSDCVVADGWLDGLRAAAYDSPRVATATPLTNNGTIVSVPDLRRPGPVPPEPWRLDRAAAAVRQRSLRIRPRLPTAIGHCMYIRRSALDLVGDLDLAFAPGYGEEVDFSQRCLRHGLLHVLADEVLVAHYGGASFAQTPDRLAIQGAHEQMIAERYPHYHDGLRALERADGPLLRALGIARRALLGTSVTLDLRGAPSGGEHDAALLALVQALSQVSDVSAGEPRRLRLAVLVSGPLRPGLARGAEIAGLTVLDDVASARARGSDVVHRIYPVSGLGARTETASLAARTIVTQADLCGFANPNGFPDFVAWESYRARTREDLEGADAVVFMSESVRAEGLAEGLVAPERSAAIAPGVDHLAVADRPLPDRPTGDGDDPPTIVCLADTCAHGNRMFVLRLVTELQERHGWSGRLVLAGRAAAHGSWSVQEQSYLAQRPRLAAATIIRAAPDAAECDRLLAQTALVIDPALCGEGDPAAPIAFVAAAHGVPCLSAPGAAGARDGEHGTGDPATTLVSWDVAASAERALALLHHSDLREHNLELTRQAARSRTWRATADALLAVYDRVSATPAVTSARPGHELARPPVTTAEAPPAPAGQAASVRRRARRRVVRALRRADPRPPKPTDREADHGGL